MKNLQEYIKESLSLDMKLNETSLLDDFDDLEANSNDAVAKSLSIGSEYKIAWTEDWIGIQKLDKKKLKELSLKSIWGQTIFNSHRGHTVKKPTKSETLLCNIILSLDKSSLVEGEYYDVKQNNSIYNTFDILTQKHFKELHKSAQHFNKDAKKETFKVHIRRSAVVGYININIEIGSSGHFINICLRKK